MDESPIGIPGSYFQALLERYKLSEEDVEYCITGDHTHCCVVIKEDLILPDFKTSVSKV